MLVAYRFLSFFRTVSPWEEPRLVAREAYFQGAHSVPEEKGYAELTAHFEVKIAGLQKASVERQKLIEGALQHLNDIAQHYYDLWTGVKARVGDTLPPFVFPIICAMVGVFVIIAEALLLAPAMDVLGITDRAAQLISAIGIAGGCAASFHFAWETFDEKEMSWGRRWTLRTIASGIGLFLVAWGLFRGREVGFAANLADSPLGSFLTGHPWLSSLFYVFISLLMPVVAASASHYSYNLLHQWWEWRHCKQEAHSISKQLALQSKQLESEKMSLQHEIQELREKCKEMSSVFSQEHERGRVHGGRQEPYWTVPLRATASSALVLFMIGLGAFLLSPVIGLLGPLVWIAAFLFHRRMWKSPDAFEFYELARVHFVERAADEKDGDLAPNTGLAGRILRSRKATRDAEALP